LIADEMGLGKTVTIIALMVRQKKPTLLVLPPHLIPQWSAEITDKAPGSLCTFVASTDFKKSEPFTDADVVIMSTSLFQKLARPQLDLLKAKEIQRIVFDESQLLGTGKKLMAHFNLLRRVKNAAVFCLSATPLTAKKVIARPTCVQPATHDLRVSPTLTRAPPSPHRVHAFC
jgi:SNF2 family DNA or RNA helicase